MSSSRNPRKPSSHRQRALERRVARLERLIAQPKPEPAQPSYPVPLYGWQRCPLCGALYGGVHACWTWNPSWQPYTGTIAPPPSGWQIVSDSGTSGHIDFSGTTTTINTQVWANN